MSIDREVVDVKKGSEAAIRDVAGELFSDFGLPPAITDAYGFKERVVQAELSYRRGGHAAINEDDVVRSVNNLTKSVGAPSWAQTDAKEVRKLRMLLILRYPHLMASEAPPDEHGNYRALDDTMSPLEATEVAGAMVDQKLLNPDFQFTKAEELQGGYLDPSLRSALSSSRSAELREVISGNSQTHSVRDLLNVADNFFTDLHVAQVASEASR